MYITNETVSFRPGSVISAEILSIEHYRAHYHDNILEMIYCLDGEIMIRAEHQILPIRKGEIFTLDPGDAHCLWSEQTNTVLLIHIDVSKLDLPVNAGQVCFFTCESCDVLEHQIDSLHEITRAILSYAYSVYCPSEISLKRELDLALYLMDILIRKFDWLSFMWDPFYQNRIVKERFHRVIEYCNAHYTQKITLKQIAQKEQISENYLSLALKKLSFQGFRNMMGFIRCFHAERLLLTTEDSALSISHQCGFSDPKYFYKYFGNTWSETPNQLRKWYRDYGKAQHIVHRADRELALSLLQEEIVAEQLWFYSLASDHLRGKVYEKASG